MARWKRRPTDHTVVEAIHDSQNDVYHTTNVKTGEYRLVSGEQHRAEFEPLRNRGRQQKQAAAHATEDIDAEMELV